MKNNNSVWIFPYRKLHYLTHPWKWFRDLYWNFRNFIHRGRYGFAYVDAWNWNSWWVSVGAAALRYIADHGCGYPGDEPFETPEKWDEHLYEMADKLDWCADSMEFDSLSENEYQSQMDEITKRCNREKKNEDGTITTYLEMTPEDEAVRDKYFERMKEIGKERHQKVVEILTSIGENFERYWD